MGMYRIEISTGIALLLGISIDSNFITFNLLIISIAICHRKEGKGINFRFDW